MRSRDDLFPAEPKIEVFLTHLAVEGNIAPAASEYPFQNFAAIDAGVAF